MKLSSSQLAALSTAVMEDEILEAPEVPKVEIPLRSGARKPSPVTRSARAHTKSLGMALARPRTGSSPSLNKLWTESQVSLLKSSVGVPSPCNSPRAMIMPHYPIHVSQNVLFTTLNNDYHPVSLVTKLCYNC